MTDKAMSEREALFRLHEIANRDTAVKVTVRADDLRALLAARASLAASAGQAKPIGYLSKSSLRCLEHNAVAAISPEGMRDAEEDIPVHLAAPMTAYQTECTYALIGRQLISSGLYDRMTDADSDIEAAGLISELVSVVDPILSAKYERHNAAPTPAAAQDKKRECCPHGIHWDNACGACTPPRGTKVLASEDERGAFDLLLNEFAATQRELAVKGEACSMRVIEHSNKLRAQIMARATASPGVSAAARDMLAKSFIERLAEHSFRTRDPLYCWEKLREFQAEAKRLLAEIERLDRAEGKS